jgi:Protein of unknown function (DUF2939)
LAILKTLRRLVAVTTVIALVAGAYIAVPFWTAWTIREAIKANDSAYLTDKIVWPSVRTTLKESLQSYSLTGAAAPIDGEQTAAKPSLWQRIKTYVGKGAVDQFVETTVTPTGMGALLNMRKAYETNVVGAPAERPPIWERMRRVWSKVTRAEFKSFDRFEMDMIDKNEPSRTISAVLERKGFEWLMTELRVKATDKLAQASYAGTLR